MCLGIQQTDTDVLKLPLLNHSPRKEACVDGWIHGWTLQCNEKTITCVYFKVVGVRVGSNYVIVIDYSKTV